MKKGKLYASFTLLVITNIAVDAVLQHYMAKIARKIMTK